MLKKFENVFVHCKYKPSDEQCSTEAPLDDVDPLDGIEPAAPLYQRLQLIVFAEPAIIPSLTKDIPGRMQNKLPQNISLVELDRDILKHENKTFFPDDGDRTPDDDFDSSDPPKDILDTTADVAAVEDYTCMVTQCNGRKFQSERMLKKHILQVHELNKPRHQCWECEKSFPVRYLLSRHRYVHERSKHQCPVCFKMLSRRSSLSLHMRSHSGEKPFTCLECGKSFTRQSGLNGHNRFIHSGESKLKCPHCDSSFSRRIELTSHLRDVHVGKRTLECELCGRCFSRTAALGAHRAKRHEAHQGGLPKFIPNNPEVKAKTFVAMRPVFESKSNPVSAQPQKYPQDLSKGNAPPKTSTDAIELKPQPIDGNTAKLASSVPQIHHPERCIQCAMVLPTRWYLIQHLRTHIPSVNDSKSEFWCQICEETLKGRYEAEEHFERWHSAIRNYPRKYECHLCKRIFKRDDHRTRHLLTHTGEKPYQCHACHRRFSRRSKLGEHLAKAHSLSLPSIKEANSRPQTLVHIEMEEGLADGSKAVVLSEGKVVGFRTVKPKRKVCETASGEILNSALQKLKKPEISNLPTLPHRKTIKRKKKKKLIDDRSDTIFD